MNHFTTQRLVIRSLMRSDEKAFFDMQSDPEVMKYIKPYMNEEESRKELLSWIEKEKKSEKPFKLWAITLKKEGELIGVIGYYENDKSEIELAYRLRKSYWNKGYASEGLVGLIDYIKLNVKVKQIVAYASPNNTGSIKILNKFMKPESNRIDPTLDIVEQKFVL